MTKLPLLLGLAAGYVLGSRAGRGHYDKLSDGVNKMWNDPRVQEKVEVAKEKAPVVTSKFADTAKSKAEDAKAKAGELKNKVTGTPAGERDLPGDVELNTPTGGMTDLADYNRPNGGFGDTLAAGEADPAAAGVTSDNWAKTEDSWKKDSGI